MCASSAALERPAPAGPSQGAVLVAFEVPACTLAFGEHLRVVGSCAELGGWDAAKAPALGWAGELWARAQVFQWQWLACSVAELERQAGC